MEIDEDCRLAELYGIDMVYKLKQDCKHTLVTDE